MERPGVRELNRIEVPAILYEVAGAFYIFSAKCFIAKCRISKGGGIMAVDIDSLQIEIEATSSDAAAKIDALAAALASLKTVAKGGAGLTTVSNQMQALANAAKLINSSSLNTAKLKEMTSALNGLSSIQKSSGLSSTINALKKLPQISESLEKADLGKFAVQMNQVASAMRPLATEMQKVSSGFSAFPIRIQKIIQSNTGLAASNSKAAKSFGVLGTGISSTQAKFGIYSVVFRQIARTASDWVKESNDYVENLNLFTVAMGDAAESALEYAEAVKEAVGIDPSEWIRNQGVFKQITGGFGVMEEKANLMSKNLTQLGYDISSFYNISIEEAMEKLQSGIAGEIEPLRRLGYAIDVATLQEVAYAHGIEQSVNTMNQAQKSQLRYLAIMEQSGNVMGDMARTVQTPANALRILNQQITQLTRALGNLLIPFLQQIIPYVQAFVEVITDAIQALALLVGFELPEIDYSGLDGVTSGATDAEDAIEGATGAAKEMKKALLGIDELTILEPTASGGGGGAGGGMGGDLGLDLPEYDFLAGLEEQASKIKEQMESILGPILSIGAGFAAWKITPKVLNWFKDLKNGKFSKIDKLAAGIGLVITGFTLEWQGGYDIGYNGLNLENAIKTAIGAGLGIAGSLLIFGTGPLGWTIGIVAALTIAIASITTGYNKRRLEDELKERFGEIELTIEEQKEIAERMMTFPLTIKLDAYVEAKDTAKVAIEKYIDSAEGLSDLVWRISVGLEVSDEDLERSIDSVVADAQNFLDAQQEVFTLAAGIGLNDENIQSDLLQFLNSFFNKSSETVKEKSAELREVIWNSVSDGVIGPEEKEAINNLISELHQVMDEAAGAEYEIKMNSLSYKLEDGISFESLTGILNEAETLAQQRIDEAAETRASIEYAIKLKYKDDGNLEEFTAGMNDAAETYFRNVAVIRGEAFQPLVNKVYTAFSDVFEENQSIFDKPIQDLIDSTFQQFSTDETGILVEGSINDFMKSVQGTWSTSIKSIDLDTDTKMAMEEAIDALKPSAEKLEELAEEFRNAGMSVPIEISNGLSEYHAINAMLGNVDSINYMLGEKFSTDPNFLQVLQTAKDAGENIDEAMAAGLLNNIEIKNNADGTISLINDTIGEKVLEVTPALKETLKTLGINMSNGLIEGVESKDTEVFNSANGIGKQVGNGIADGLDDSTRAVKNAADRLVDIALSATKTAAKIHSPSRLFRDEVGLNIGLGISEGIGNSRDAILSEIELTNQRMVSAFSTGSIGSLSRSFSVEEVKNINTHTSGTVTVTDGREGQREINQEMISTLFAISQQIISAIEENSGNVYLDGDKVGERVTEYQNRKNRIFGR